MKKKMKSMIAILTAIAVVGTANYFPKNENFRVENLISVSANSSDGVFNYEIIDNEAIIVGVNDTNAYTLKIPDEMDGYPVTGIGENAFSDCKNLTSIEISKSVKDIENGMFYWCCNLTKIIVDENNSNYCDVDGVLFDKEKTVLYKFPNSQLITSYSILDTVTRIDNGAFAGCSNLTNIKLPNSITSIGNNAFGGCDSLTSIEIPDSVKSIGDLTFSRCSELTSITIPDSVTSIGWGAFYDCTGLTSITIPDSVTYIAERSFSYCSALTSITIPNSVTIIGEWAFSDCSGLTSITIPNSVTIIGEWTFSGCRGLTSITIPDSVTYIAERSFSYCSNLTEIIVEKNNLNYCGIDGVLFNKDKTLLYRYPEGKVSSSYSMPNSVTSIGRWAFSDCSGLTSITIPDSVTSIGDGVFAYCSGLASITIPNSVTSIGHSAFSSCSGLTSITISNSVTSIGWGAFHGCNLEFVIIPESVDYIGGGAFGYDANNKKIGDFKIYGYVNSEAQNYAEKSEMEFVPIDNGYTVTTEPNTTTITPTTTTKAQTSNTISGGLEFSVGNVSGNAGDLIEVPIIMSGNTDGVSGINIELVYDRDALELTDCFMPDNQIFSGTWMASKNTGYVVFVTGLGENEIGNGVVGLALFKIKDTASAGEKSISIGYAKYSKQTADNQAAFSPKNLISGSVTVKTNSASSSYVETEAVTTMEPALTEPTITVPVTTAESATTIEPTITTRITSTEPAVTTKVNTTGTAVTIRVTTIPPINTSVTSVPTTQRPVVTTTTIKTEVISGNNYDLDENGTVTPIDLVKMKKQILGYETVYAQTADVNNDGTVDAKDLVALVKYLLEN